MSDKTPQGETEEEYYARIKSVPGIYSDYNETAKSIVERPERLVEDAEVRAELTDLAPEVHPEDQEDAQVDEAVGYVYPGTDAKSVAATDDSPKKSSKKDEDDEKKDDEVTKRKPAASKKENEKDATGPAGEYAEQLPAEDQAGLPPKE